MRIAVTDANIFIDLFYLDQYLHLFSIGCEIHTTRHVIMELEEQHAAELEILSQKGSLQIISVLTEDQPFLVQLRQAHRGLSETDLSVMAVAVRINAMVLSGDDLVRKSCHRNSIEIHGILWCLNQFTEHELISKKEACHLLAELMKFNKRLPSAACKHYLEEVWK